MVRSSISSSYKQVIRILTQILTQMVTNRILQNLHFKQKLCHYVYMYIIHFDRNFSRGRGERRRLENSKRRGLNFFSHFSLLQPSFQPDLVGFHGAFKQFLAVCSHIFFLQPLAGKKKIPWPDFFQSAFGQRKKDSHSDSEG